LATRRAEAERAKSNAQFIGHVCPKTESISPGVTVGGCGEAVAFGAKERGYLVVGGEEYLRLFGRFEPAHDLFALSGMLV
jgi:hypothetical protein